MKSSLILFLCFWVHICHISAFPIQASYKNGTAYIPSTPITDRDTCVFKFTESGNADWTLYIKGKEPWEKESHWIERKYVENTSVFTITPREFPIRWSSHDITVNESNLHSIVHGIIVCKNNIQEDTIAVSFDVLPAKPIFKSIELHHGKFDWDTGSFSTDPYFIIDLNILCPFTNLYLGFSCVQKPDSKIIEYYYEPKVENVGDNTYQISDIFDMFQIMTVVVTNDFGAQRSDTIAFRDYFKDSEVLEYIRQETSINTQNETKPSFHISNGILYSEQAKSIRICTLDGKQNTHIKGNQLNLSYLPKGQYIIEIITSTNKFQFKVSL